MGNNRNVCPECLNEPSVLFKCYKCDKLYCEQCTLKQKIDLSGGESEVRIKYFCPKCNGELHETVNLSQYIRKR